MSEERLATLWLIVCIVLMAALWYFLASTRPTFAHDHDNPARNEWLKSLHSQSKTWCCNGDDTDAIEEWQTKGNGYRVKFRGQWFDVPEGAIVDGPNKGGEALLWMNRGTLGISVRCFMPGSLT